jgi:hypothetical protein
VLTLSAAIAASSVRNLLNLIKPLTAGHFTPSMLAVRLALPLGAYFYDDAGHEAFDRFSSDIAGTLP